MFKDVICEELQWGGTTLKLETGRMARQATSAVYASYNDTSVLATVVVEKTANPEFDFVPLSVFYQEKFYAAGRIPGGFFKREGKPTEGEVLISRLIDRPMRPLFDKYFRNETQVMVTLLSYDAETKPDILAIIAASAALQLAGVPFGGPVGGVRVGLDAQGRFLLNPTRAQMAESQLDLVVAGTREGVLMVESEASELSEEKMLEAVTYGHTAFQPVIEMIERLAQKAGKPAMVIEPKEVQGLVSRADVEALVRADVKEAYGQAQKAVRHDAISELKARVLEKILDTHKDALDREEVGKSEMTARVMSLFKDIERDIVRTQVLETGRRIDGRDLETVRPIDVSVGVLPRTHGSALFTRGETQALVVTTLGTSDDEQRVDGLEGEYKETFILHYNFPSFSVGEVGRPGSTGRREIGHGKLAWRAIHPLLPDKESFPHTIRVVSDILESNGSSSMATVCGASLALMDACVPLARSVAGIAMGLIKEGEKYAVLTDILGDEDNLGDMDFKVARTRQGITALQMDIKITSITADIMRVALEQAQRGVISILGKMEEAISEPRPELKAHMPRVEVMTIPKEKIREVIGTGGKVIREITEKTTAKINIDDTGLKGVIKISSSSTEAIQAAVDWIKGIVFKEDFRPEPGQIYNGEVVRVMPYGVFVNFAGTRRDGLVHTTEMNVPVEGVEAAFERGDKVKVKVIGFDDQGKVRLSMKRVDQETGQDIDNGEPTTQGAPRSSEGRGRGGPRPEGRGGRMRRSPRQQG